MYLIGIKGAGMAALAVYLKEKGHNVWGSDTAELFPTETTLFNNNIKIIEGFKAENIIGEIDIVVATGAHGGLNNIEAMAAKEKNIPIQTLAEFIGDETKKYKTVISVCGTHGKTTISAMIAYVLNNLGLKSSHLVGTGNFSGLNGGHFGGDDFLVLEADEYVSSPGIDNTPRFMYQNPHIIICTSVEHDHPDAYPTPSDLENAYIRFFQKLDHEKGVLIYCQEDKMLEEMASELNLNHKISYSEADIRLSIPGRHNRLNASSVIALASVLNLERGKVEASLKSFSGSQRRFEKMYEDKIVLIDDYAHHPTEIRATIEAAHQKYPSKRLFIIFQSHTYSRTQEFRNEFIDALSMADKVLITDIFASAREEGKVISGQDLAEEAKKAGKFNIDYCALGDIVSTVESQMKSGDVIITMGAGSLYNQHSGIIDAIKHTT